MHRTPGQPYSCPKPQAALTGAFSSLSAPRLGFAIACVLLIQACLSLPTDAAPPIKSMVRIRLAGETYEGQPLAWNQSQVHLLSRDGQLISFRIGSGTDLRESAPRFSSFTPSEIRARLHNEFDSQFKIDMTQHYVVVYPKGSKAPWANRFEEFYKQFHHYFRIRGAKLFDAECPLIAIVFPNKAAYQKYSAEHGMPISENYWGHYSRSTNRVYLFDVQADYPHLNWEDTAALIVHEATHQIAFNCGIHTRFGDPPRWVTEGLAMMFESRGVYNSTRYRQQADRINQDRLKEFRATLSTRPEHWFTNFILTDRPFSTHEKEAYAESWAFSFFLCETYPREYAKYLELTAQRDDFSNYSAVERIEDFTKIFGENIQMLDSKFLRFVEKLK